MSYSQIPFTHRRMIRRPTRRISGGAKRHPLDALVLPWPPLLVFCPLLASCHRYESTISLRQATRIGSVASRAWKNESGIVKSLQSVSKHWPIALLEDSWLDLYDVIRSNADQVVIEGRMMEFAEREAVCHQWFTTRFLVSNDVCGV